MTFLNWPTGYNTHLFYIYLRKNNTMKNIIKDEK